MFKNPGSKLETIAYVWFFIRIIICLFVVIGALKFLRDSVYLVIYIDTGNMFIIILIMIILILIQTAVAYFESLLLCCFATITMNSEHTVNKLNRIENRLSRINASVVSK